MTTKQILARLELLEKRVDEQQKTINDLREKVAKTIRASWMLRSLLAMFGDAAQGVADFKE